MRRSKLINLKNMVRLMDEKVARIEYRRQQILAEIEVLEKPPVAPNPVTVQQRNEIDEKVQKEIDELKSILGDTFVEPDKSTGFKNGPSCESKLKPSQSETNQPGSQYPENDSQPISENTTGHLNDRSASDLYAATIFGASDVSSNPGSTPSAEGTKSSDHSAIN